MVPWCCPLVARWGTNNYQSRSVFCHPVGGLLVTEKSGKQQGRFKFKDPGVHYNTLVLGLLVFAAVTN